MAETSHLAAPSFDHEWFTRVYREEEPRLTAYASSRVAPGRLGGDLVADVAFRTWRRLAVGHQVPDLAAELTRALRDQLESLTDSGAGTARNAGGSPTSQVALLARVFTDMPARQVKAVWLVEVEGLPLARVGLRLRTHLNAAAILLHLARENMRQGLLQAQSGTPRVEACLDYWQRMPAHVRGVDPAAAAVDLSEHTQRCDDCRQRLAQLGALDDQLQSLVGPALITLLAHGQAPYLLPMVGAGAQAVASVEHAVRSGNGVTPFRFVRSLADRAFGPSATLVGVTLIGAVAVGTRGPGGRGRERAGHTGV